MSGIRLYHPTIRPPIGAEYAVYVVETHIRYPVPYACPLCNKVEQRKSIHLRIGPDGYVVVSGEVWDKLAPVLPDSGLETEGEILNPPDVVVGGVALAKQAIVHQPLNLDKKYGDSYNPGRTLQESKLIIPRLVFKEGKP